MNRAKHLVGKLEIVLCSALLGYTTYAQPSVSVGVSLPLPSVEVVLPSVEIRAESDFYEPLAPQGEWLVVGSYGRVWRPQHVDRDWRPYSDGYWQRTDEGWYWVSDEPWAWATYHYGRWDYADEYGWYWVPQTQWAPAWVSWHEGGGYVGWAPLYPSGVRVISPRAYVFVEERHFLKPVRRSTVVVNNTTIINNTVINQGPATIVIEKASGRKIEAVPVRELRHKQEAAVVRKQRTPAATSEKGEQPPARNEARHGEKKSVVEHESPQVEKPDAAKHEVAAPIPKNNKRQSEMRQSAPATEESKPTTKPEGNHPPVIKEPAREKNDQDFEKQDRQDRQSDKKERKPAKGKPVASEKSELNPADNGGGFWDYPVNRRDVSFALV